MKFFKTIKFRLTLWYLTVIAALLLIFGGAAYFILSNNLYQNLDTAIEERANELEVALQAGNGRALIVERLDELVLVYDSRGNLLQHFGANVELASTGDLVERALTGEHAYLTGATSDGQEVRLYAAPVSVNLFTSFAVIVGQPTVNIHDVLGTFRYILGASGLVVFILAGISGFVLANRALKPVDRITRTAQDIGESDLTRRINVPGEDELGRLAATLNNMIARIEAAFNRQRQFTADASHELRTPLAVIQAEATLALSKERSETEYKKSLEAVSQEAAYMASLIGKLLFLARSDAGKEPLALEEVNLKRLITELFSDVEVLARDKGLLFHLGPLEDLTVRGDRVKMRQLCINLLENAVRYTPAGGTISGSIVRRGDEALIIISDTGAGIPAEHLPHIFERFYRVDKARSRAEGGAGLGLAIAKYIAEIHDGHIEAESEVGLGTVFRVSLPLLKTPPLPAQLT
jgi:heavy metal sensor kinase